MADKEDKDYTDYKNKPPPYGRDESRVYPEQARPGAQFKTENWDYGPPYYQPGWRGGLQKPSGPNPKTYAKGGSVKRFAEGGATEAETGPSVRQITPVLPRSMRPRSSANAEINAQTADKVRRDAGGGYPLAKNQPYATGGKVMGKERSQANYCKGGKVISVKSW